VESPEIHATQAAEVSSAAITSAENKQIFDSYMKNRKIKPNYATGIYCRIFAVVNGSVFART